MTTPLFFFFFSFFPQKYFWSKFFSPIYIIEVLPKGEKEKKLNFKMAIS
jgi:hypothetical protein